MLRQSGQHTAAAPALYDAAARKRHNTTHIHTRARARACAPTTNSHTHAHTYDRRPYVCICVRVCVIFFFISLSLTHPTPPFKVSRSRRPTLSALRRRARLHALAPLSVILYRFLAMSHLAFPLRSHVSRNVVATVVTLFTSLAANLRTERLWKTTTWNGSADRRSRYGPPTPLSPERQLPPPSPPPPPSWTTVRRRYG